MNPSAPCEKCIASPERINLSGGLPVDLPASIAWLRTDSLHTTLFAKGQTVRPQRPVDEGKDLLSTVVLSMVARNRLTLYAVSHRLGFVSRLFGKSGDAAIHVVASDSSSGDEGLVERKLLDAVTRGARPNAPHGSSLDEAVGLLFPFVVASPAVDVLQWAREDAVARGVGRWIQKEEVPSPPLTVKAGESRRN